MPKEAKPAISRCGSISRPAASALTTRKLGLKLDIRLANSGPDSTGGSG
jgi:hypothetical protein